MSTYQGSDFQDTGEGQASVLAIHLNQDLGICKINTSLQEKTGFLYADVLGRDTGALLHESTPLKVRKSLERALVRRFSWMGQVCLLTSNGPGLWVTATVVPLPKQPGKPSFLLTFIPLPDQHIKSAENAAEKMAHQKTGVLRGLWRKIRGVVHNLKIGQRIGLMFTVLSAFAAALLIGYQLYTVENIIDDSVYLELSELTEMVNAAVEAEGSRAASLATLVANLPQTQQAMERMDREALSDMFLGTYKELAEKFGLRQFQFHTGPATSFLRLHKPEKFGDDLSSFRHTVVEANTAKITVLGLERGRAGYGIRGVVPVIKDGRMLGTVEFGSSFTQYFFDQFKSKHQVEIAFLSTEGESVEIIGTTFADTSLISKKSIEVAMDKGSSHVETLIGETPFSIYLEPMHDYSGNRVGVIAIAKDRSPSIARIAEIRQETGLIALGVMAVNLLMAFLIALGISGPVAAASRLAKKISDGDYNNVIALGRKDEVGQLQNAMSNMQAKMAYDRHETLAMAKNTARIKLALDYISANVTVSGPDGNLIFINSAATDMFTRMHKARQKSFNAELVQGNPLSALFDGEPLPAVLQELLTDTETHIVRLWDHDFKLVINPVYGKNGDYIARVTQWIDITSEVLVEKEIRQIVSDANRGDLSGRISADDKSGFFADLAGEINSLIEGMDRVFQDIDTAMKQVSRGNLTQPIEKDYSGTYGSVRDSVNGTISHLDEMIRDLRLVSTGIGGYSEQISGRNDELSRRTEKQAANLEETAASMVEITGTVKENAENATAATELAGEAQRVSVEGVEVIQQSISAMSSITEASHKIEEIIGVIDEIAFQTNLLALNAAVEAARAGEQGRGFAVVAGEVRDLASRSAEAAKQVKTLINDSVERVSDGTTLVNNAGGTLNQIAESISKVALIIEEIATSNQEQSRGISQVNNAVAQVDEATQKNAGLAEETTGVAVKLRDRSAELDHMISKFVVSESNNGSNFSQSAEDRAA